MPDLPPVYYTHPAYAQSPVSCVSYEGAMLFCQWLTEKMGGEEFNAIMQGEATAE